MSRERLAGDVPRCRCGKPAVWSGLCQMADGKGWCNATALPFPNGAVELEAELFRPSDFAVPAALVPKSTKEPELVGKVLARTIADLNALVEFTDDNGEWKQRVRRALRELDAAHYTSGDLTWEPVPAERAYLEVDGVR